MALSWEWDHQDMWRRIARHGGAGFGLGRGNGMQVELESEHGRIY